MRKFRIISAVLLVIVLFINIDLSLNFFHSLIPELQDGISSHSILQVIFGVFGERGWTKAKFFYAFEKSQWLTLVLLMENIVLAMLPKKKNVN